MPLKYNTKEIRKDDIHDNSFNLLSKLKESGSKKIVKEIQSHWTTQISVISTYNIHKIVPVLVPPSPLLPSLPLSILLKHAKREDKVETLK